MDQAGVQRVGARLYGRRHRPCQLADLAAVLAVVHFIWRVKIDVRQPLSYAFLLGALLLVRVVVWPRQRSANRASP